MNDYERGLCYVLWNSTYGQFIISSLTTIDVSCSLGYLDKLEYPIPAFGGEDSVWIRMTFHRHGHNYLSLSLTAEWM